MRKSTAETKITYGGEIEKLVDLIISIINKDEGLAEKYPARWMAIKLLEKDEDVLEKINGSTVEAEILEAIA